MICAQGNEQVCDRQDKGQKHSKQYWDTSAFANEHLLLSDKSEMVIVKY